MLIREILSKPIVTVPEGSSIREVASLMSEHQVSFALIVDSKKQIIGIVTERDITRAIAKGIPYDEKIDKIMTKTIITIRDNENVIDALNLMLRNSIRHLVVIDSNDNFVGVVSIRDIAQALGLMYDY